MRRSMRHDAPDRTVWVQILFFCCSLVLFADDGSVLNSTWNCGIAIVCSVAGMLNPTLDLGTYVVIKSFIIPKKKKKRKKEKKVHPASPVHNHS